MRGEQSWGMHVKRGDGGDLGSSDNRTRDKFDLIPIRQINGCILYFGYLIQIFNNINIISSDKIMQLSVVFGQIQMYCSSSTSASGSGGFRSPSFLN